MLSEQFRFIQRQRIGRHDLQAARIGARNIFQRRQAAIVALDADDFRRALHQQRARQPPGPGANFIDRRTLG